MVCHSTAYSFYIGLPVAGLRQCAPRKYSWVSKAHIDVSQPFLASKCRLTKDWGLGFIAVLYSCTVLLQFKLI